jgi:hypothetical protein
MTDFRQDQTNERNEVRRKPLILKVSGAYPTLPYPLSLKVGARGWKITDLADGEYCINSADDLFFWRSGDQIFTLNISNQHLRKHALDSTLDHTSTIVTGHMMDADVNGLPHDSGITTAAVLASLIITGRIRGKRLNLLAGVPYVEVFTVGGVPTPLSANWIFTSSPYAINDRPSKVDPVITARIAAGFTATAQRDTVMEYTAIDPI